MVVVLFLGERDEYLGYKTFQYRFKADLFVDSIHPLMLANIEKTLPLKERLQLAPGYFPFAGRVQNIELIDLNEKGESNE